MPMHVPPGDLLSSWLPVTRYASVEAYGEPPHSFTLEVTVELTEALSDVWLDSYGSLHASPTAVTSEGELALRPPDPDGSREAHEVLAEADDDGHSVEGYHVVEDQGLFDSRDDARRAVVNTADSLADDGLDLDVDLDTYHRDGDEVTVGYQGYTEGLDEAASRHLGGRLGGDGGGIGDAGGDGGGRRREPMLEVGGVELWTSRRDGESAYGWEVDLSGSPELAASSLAALGVEDAETVADLRRETGFAVDVDWNAWFGDVFTFDVEYTARNSGEYAEGLRSQGLETPAESGFTFEYMSDAAEGETTLNYHGERPRDAAASSGDVAFMWMNWMPAPVPWVAVYLEGFRR